MTTEDGNRRLFDQPFRPFRIHLSDGSSIPIVNAGRVIVSDTTAILPVETGRDADGHPMVKRWRTVSLPHRVQFSDIDEPVSGKGKKST